MPECPELGAGNLRTTAKTASSQPPPMPLIILALLTKPSELNSEVYKNLAFNISFEGSRPDILLASESLSGDGLVACLLASAFRAYKL